MSGLHGHFIQQVKRFAGAVQSGHPAAWLGMFLKAVGPPGRFLDRCVSGSPSEAGSKSESMPACVMIVSPPRSGSTLIYQALTRAIPCVYLSNLHLVFPSFASGWLMKRDRLGRNSGFDNFYGYTSSLSDVCEGNELVGEWFEGGPDHRRVREKFLCFIEKMRASETHPLIFKNVRNYTRISILHQAVPELVFLRIRRNTEQTVQSVVKAYHELGGFHPVPPALEGRVIGDPVEFAVRQILEIEREIDAQKRAIDPSVWLEWTYENFCSDAWAKIEGLAENYLKMDKARLRRDGLSEPLTASRRPKVSEQEARRITELLRKLEPNPSGES